MNINILPSTLDFAIIEKTLQHTFRTMPGHGLTAFPTGHEGHTHRHPCAHPHPRLHRMRAPTRDTVVNVAKEQRLWRGQKHKHGCRRTLAVEGAEHFMCI